MATYNNPYDLIANTFGSVLELLTTEEQEYLRSALDFECIIMRVHDGMVDITDSISEEVYNTLSVKEYIRNLISWAVDNA